MRPSMSSASAHRLLLNGLLAAFAIITLASATPVLAAGGWQASSDVVQPEEASGAGPAPPLGRGPTILFYDDMEGGTNGWTSVDNTIGRVPRFHIDSYMAYGGSGNSWWCGTFDYDANGGYGNKWDEALKFPTVDWSGYTHPILSFNYRSDSELWYDQTFLEFEQGGEMATLGFFHGKQSWQAAPLYALSSYDNPAVGWFRFYSDSGWSDEDGNYMSTGGAFMCDDVRIYDQPTGDTFFYDDCESGGLCTPWPPGNVGDYWHIMDRACWAESPPHSWWCGDDGDTTQLPAGLDNSLYSPLIDISGLTASMACTLRFTTVRQFPYTGGDPPPWDFYEPEISVDGGLTWVNPTGSVYVGEHDCDAHSTYSVDVTPYLPGTDFQYRLTVETSSDGSGPSVQNAVSVAMDEFLLFAHKTPPGVMNVPGDYATIQAAINAADTGDTIVVAAGTYNERLNVNKPVHLRGAQYGVDPTPFGARTNPANESVVDIAGLPVTNPNVAIEIPNGVTDVEIDGFTLVGSPTFHYSDESIIRCWDDNVTIGNNIMDGYIGILCKGAANQLVDQNRMVVNKNGVIVQPNPGMDVTISGNYATLGTSPAGDESAFYMTGCSQVSVTGNTAIGFLNAKAATGSNVDHITVSGNTFDGCKDAISYWGTTTFVTISDNTLVNSVRYGISIKGQDITISGNSITNSGDSGINIDRHVIDTERVTITDNDLSGNTSYGLRVNTSLVTETVDASSNYWGSTDAATVKASANGGVGADFTPWLGGGTAQNPGYAGDFSTLYVDDDSPQTGSETPIQEAIDLAVGSTVNVMDGTYGANATTGKGAYITTDGLSLVGESEAGTIIDGAIGGVGSSASYWPKGIHVEAENVTVQNFTVRGFTGDMISTGGYGVLHRDYAHDTVGEGYIFYDGCTVDNVTVEDCYSAVYALCFTHLTVTGCTVQNNFADGMFIARGSDYATIDGNTVTNSGDHGIWVGYSWTATTPSDHAVITDNAVDGAREGGISFVGSDDATIEGNAITNVAAEGWSVGALSLKDSPSNVTARYNVIYGNDGTWNGYAGTGHGIGIDGTPANIALNWNSVTGNAGDGCHNYSTVNIDATYCWWGDASGPSGVGPGTGDEVSTYVLYDPWIGKAGTENIVCDPDPLILNVASLPNTPDGEIDVNYLGGGGGLLYGYSVTVTWDDTVADLAGVTQGNLLSDAGTTQFFVYGSGNTRTIDCTILGGVDGVTGPGTMFTLGFDADSFGTSAVDITIVAMRDRNNNPLSGFFEDDGEIQVDVTNPDVASVLIENTSLAHTDDYAKDTDDLLVTATITDDYALTASDIVADLSALLAGGGTAVQADAYASPTATWTLTSVSLGADGPQTVTVTATDGLGNVGTNSDDIIVDNTPPLVVTGFSMEPMHEGLVMSWDDPSTSDTNHYGLLVRYDDWDDYPYYDLVPPLYPADETGGEGDLYDGDGLVMYWEAPKVDRDISYASAFHYDYALNYSTVDAGGQDRSTSYWLGDVAAGLGAWGYNGLVNAADIDKLGGNYGSAPLVGVPGYAECDVGPTDSGGPLAIPEPDDFLGFEDLMIFAMNYGEVAPRVVPFLPDESTKALSLELAEAGVTADGEVEVALRLEGNATEVKGLSVVVAFESAELEFISARLSDHMFSPIGEVFFWSREDDSTVQIDVAVLGTGVTIGGSGDVVVLTFRSLSDMYVLGFEGADLRGANNEDLYAELENLEAKPDVPTSYRLVGNTPNPFNPVTKISYSVPFESRVSVRVYDVSGRLVRTLVDGLVEPGDHEVVWDGRSDSAESVGSGVYFCTMEAADFHDSHKMMLLK